MKIASVILAAIAVTVVLGTLFLQQSAFADDPEDHSDHRGVQPRGG